MRATIDEIAAEVKKTKEHKQQIGLNLPEIKFEAHLRFRQRDSQYLARCRYYPNGKWFTLEDGQARLLAAKILIYLENRQFESALSARNLQVTAIELGQF